MSSSTSEHETTGVYTTAMTEGTYVCFCVRSYCLFNLLHLNDGNNLKGKYFSDYDNSLALSGIIQSSQMQSALCKVSGFLTFAHVRVTTFKKEHYTSCFKAPASTTPDPLVTTISGLLTSESQTTETSGVIMILTLAVYL